LDDVEERAFTKADAKEMAARQEAAAAAMAARQAAAAAVMAKELRELSISDMRFAMGSNAALTLGATVLTAYLRDREVLKVKD